MKKTLLMASVLLAFSVEAHAMVKTTVVCPNVDLVRKELNSALDELRETLSRKLNLQAGHRQLVGNVGGEITRLTLHHNGSQCQYKVDGVVLYEVSLK